ncbi:hypothetical protein GBZ48_18240 [Azospirillum melinis]|uniref:Orc1-like AAA ATPase domain-containing protein n=1 Tax=Azospirillum melinis TaxID=328839 RepID=A0ABX2KIG0_9PROT|nr:AAA family ATPase [Azospirillum melinis]MBP2309689.1 DNA-binding MarR family transcriptional regulator [Azospirillum melinis]NUB01211.1 hypothetical protein [Azospirillum melinis]
MSVWEMFGFRDNPFSTDPVPPNDEGTHLLVGRDRELARLRMSLTSSANHTTIEGANGVGKSSLVGIASYTLFQDHLRDRKRPLYIPVNRPFQISSTESAADFSATFLYTLAREISNRRDLIAQHHSGLRNLDDLDTWLNDPVLTSGGGGLNILGTGASGNIARSANSSQGFANGGVEAHLREMLQAIFPNARSGSFICVLDNLELLDTSTKARATLEELRDGVLSLPGVKWILCGARGILRSVVSTPRLQGKLADPVELYPLGPSAVTEVIRTRLELYKIRPDAYTPVEADGFRKIYQIGNHNLRISLKYCEDFVLWCALNDNLPQTSEDKFGLIDAWFSQIAEDLHINTMDVTPRAWRLFDQIAEKPEGCSPGDYAEFDFNSGPAMQPHLRNLEQAQLIHSATDDVDRRRKTINLTPRGWIVRYHRCNYQLPPAA